MRKYKKTSSKTSSKTRSNIRRKNIANNKTKKMYIMKGCSKSNANCKSFFSSKKTKKYQNQTGGCDSSCGLTQTGGSFYKPAELIPGSTVGAPWTATDWPGSTDLIGNNSYFPLNKYLTDPQTSMKSSPYYLGGGQQGQQGGKRRIRHGNGSRRHKIGGYVYNNKLKSDNFNKTNSNKTQSNKSSSNKTKSLRGGGLIPQDLVNLGRGFMYNIGSAYNAVNGYKAPINPLPYKDQYTKLQNHRNFKIQI